MYKLQKFMCHYNIRKYSFCARVVNIGNSLPNEVVEANTVNAFKNRLDKHWSNQDILFDFNADFNWNWKCTNLYVIVSYVGLRCGQRGLPAPVRTHWIVLDWIVCLTVRLSRKKTTRANFTKFSVHVIRGRGSVLL